MKFKWTVEFEVDELWVADGFDLTDERARDMIAEDLRFAQGPEISAKVIAVPNPDDIAKCQGYASADEMKAAN